MITCRHDTAVVVLSYNGRHLHQLFFPELLRESEGKYDVVLIDNASTDDTAAWVAEHFPAVQIIRLGVNRGFANGYFEGLQQISARYYVLLSADFEITPGWFAPLHQLMEKHPDLGALQPKIKYYREKEKFEYAGAGGGFMDKWGYLFCRGRIFFTLEDDLGQYDDHVETFWAGGGCMFVRADLYHLVGGLDRDLYAHMEEVDLCWRMKNHGFRIGYCGSSTVYHIGGSVISYGSPQKIFYNYRNSLILLYKNLPLARLLWLLPWRLVLDGVSGARAALKGDWKEVGAILRAHGSFYAQWFSLVPKRLHARSLVNRPRMSGIYKGSIIWDYFVKGRKKFSDLPVGKLMQPLD